MNYFIRFFICFFFSLNFCFLAHASENPHLYLFYRLPDPGGSVELTDQYKEFKPIPQSDMFYQFVRRLEDFSKALENDKVKSLGQLNHSILTTEQVNRVLLEPIRHQIKTISSNLSSFEQQLVENKIEVDSQTKLLSGYQVQTQSEDHLSQFVDLHTKLNFLDAGTDSQALLKEFGLLTLEAADRLLAASTPQQADILFETPQELFNQALQTLPGQGENYETLESKILPDWVYEEGLHNIPLLSTVDTPEGIRVRALLNAVLLAERLAQKACSGAETTGLDCPGFKVHSENLKLALLLSDRIAAQGHQPNLEAYYSLTGTLEPFIQALKGFTRGMIKGGLSVAGGVAAVVFLPETVLLSVATATLGYGIYKALDAIRESEGGIQGIFRRKWREFSSAPLEKQTEITTEIAVEIAGLWFAGKLVQVADTVLAQATEFTLKRVAVHETAQELSAQGTISREIAQTVQNFAEGSPVEAAKLIQEGQTPQRFKAFTEVREIFVAQGASQEAAQLDLAGIQAAKVLDSAGTVWSKISNEAEHMGRTIIPKRFDILAGTEKFHVHPNATKHMGEIFAKKQHTHMTPMHNQVVLGSFHNALEEVARTGAWKQSIQTGEVIIEKGWEFIFSQRSGDLLPVIKHARQLNF